MKKVIAIAGPTAVGKSALGLKLASQFNGEIISGDSMQIYRGLDIGTAKDSPEELKAIKHHLVDICDVSQRYTVKDFQKQAIEAINSITSVGRVPMIVGGTGFYLNALIQNLDLGGSEETDLKLRQELLELENKEGIAGLQNRLKSIDPSAMKTIDIDNPRRVIRAIEVFEQTGKSISVQTNGQPIADFYVIGLTDDRQILYDRINSRVDKMMDLGLTEEAKGLFNQRNEVPQAKNGIGYKELFPYFEGKRDLQTSVEEIKKNSRHFAKRQLTYFRNQLDVDWYNIDQQPDFYQEISAKVTKFIK